MTAHPIHFATAPHMIGKHEWRIVVMDSAHRAGVRCTDCQWRKLGGDWNPSTDWPAYNGNDTYNGLPRTLGVIYERAKPDITAVLAGQEPPASPQMSLL